MKFRGTTDINSELRIWRSSLFYLGIVKGKNIILEKLRFTLCCGISQAIHVLYEVQSCIQDQVEHLFLQKTLS